MTEPVRVDPDALYDDRALRLTLGVRDSAVEKARKSGELKSTRRGGKYIYTGKWVLDWLIAEVAQDNGIHENRRRSLKCETPSGIAAH